MNGVHDMGGMHGFGPIEHEVDEPVFHATWEGKIFGIRRALLERYPIYDPEGFRFALESLPPDTYLMSTYFERWLLVTEKALIDKGLLTAEELDAKTQFFREHPEARVPRQEDPEQLERILGTIFPRQPLSRDPDVVPGFKIGDTVKACNINPSGHTRLPRYIRGKRGVINRYYAVYNFQDTPPDGSETQPQAVYNVRFDSGEVWGDAADTNQSIFIDMWESYLEHA